MLATPLNLPYTLNDPVFAWAAILLTDVWHWTGFVVFLADAGLAAKSIVGVLFRAGGPLGFANLPILCAAGVLTILPGLMLVFFVRRHLARGLSMGPVG